MMKIRTLVSLLLLLSVFSCKKTDIKLWEDFDCVVNANGVVSGYKIDKNRPFIITYSSIDCLKMNLDQTSAKAVNGLVSSGLGTFVYYCRCSVSDTLEISASLKQAGHDYCVIIDPEGDFMKMNGGDPNNVMDITYLCDRNLDIVDVHVLCTENVRRFERLLQRLD